MGAPLLITLEGYAIEGGFDVPGGIATCYAPTTALGRHPAAGAADGLWGRYEEVLALVGALGVAGVRLTVEWARVEPRAGEVDEVALARYVEIVAAARARGLRVTVALVDAVWPSWLGMEAWLLPWVAPRVVDHARLIARTISDPEVRFVTFTQRDSLVRRGFLEGSAPPWRRGARRDATAAAAQLARLEEELRRDRDVGPRTVATFRTVEVNAPLADIARSRRADVSELYLRSLVRGHGPTRAAAGLLAEVDGGWRVNAPDDLLAALV